MRPVVVEAVDIKRPRGRCISLQNVRAQWGGSHLHQSYAHAGLVIDRDCMAYVLYAGAAKRTDRRGAPGGRGRSRRKSHLHGKPTRQNVLFCAVATDRQLTVEAVPNGGSARGYHKLRTSLTA
jgi:hypothetical protein